MQHISSPLGSELWAKEDPCDCHLIGVFGCNAIFIPQWLKNGGELVVCAAKGLWTESLVLWLSLMAITVDALSSMVGVDWGSSSQLIWGWFISQLQCEVKVRLKSYSTNFFRLNPVESLLAHISWSLSFISNAFLVQWFLYKWLMDLVGWYYSWWRWV